MASATIHGKFDLDLRGKKVEGLAAATANGEAVRYEQIQNLTGDNVIIGDNLTEGETLTVPVNNWLVLPNSVKHYLYYNHTGSAYTITAPAGGYTLAQIASAINTDGTLTLINTDVDISGKQDKITEYAFETPYVIGDTVYSNGEIWECLQNITSHAELRPQNLPLVWKAITTHVELIDTLDALQKLNAFGEAAANISAGELFSVYNDTVNNGLYRVVSTGGTGTVVSKVASQEVGGIYPRAASETDTDFNERGGSFTILHGSTWYFENNLWVYEGGLYGDGGLLIDNDSKTFLNRPQHSASTADWIRLHSIEWSQHIAYFEGDIVTYTTGTAGSTTTIFYRAKQSITGASNNSAPPTDTTTWEVFETGGEIPADVPRQQNISVTSGSSVTNGGTVSASGAITVNVNTPDSGVDVEETFPNNAPLGHQIFLDPAGNNVTVVDSNGHRRPRGFYSYIQPLSNPNSRYWEQITIPEVPELYNNAREADLIYLTDPEEDFNGPGNNFASGFYRAGPTSANAQTWISTGGTTGNSVEVNGIRVHNADFRSHPEAATYLYSPPFQSDENTTTGDTDVSVQVDTREIGNALGINSLRAQVHQIEEELSQPGEYTWVDEQVFVDVFITNRTNSSGTLNQATILQPHFEDNSNVFTTYAVLTGDADTGLRNQWNGFNSNAAGIIVGLGPDDTDLVAFQLLSTYYRDSTAAGLAEIRLKMIDPDGAFAGPSQSGTNTNKQQFISWISDNDNPITPEDPNPVIHQGISTYYYETDNDFLDTVRHNVGSHITGSALTADERVIIDNLLVPMIDVPTTIPGGPNLTTFAADASQSGSADSGGWYWRNNQTGSGAVTPDPTDWADLVQGDGVSNANSDEWHVLICRPADAAQATLVENIAGNIGFKIANTGGTVTSNNLGSLFVSDGTTDNFAELEVVVSPTSQTSTSADVRFRIKRVIQSRGVPPVNQTVTISDAGVVVNVPTRSGDPSFQENLDITGNLDVGGAITINGAALPTGITAPQAIAAVEGNANTFTAANTFNTTVNGADANAIAYVAIQLSASVPQDFTPTGAVADHVYLRYTARYNGAEAVLVDDINTGADPVTSTTYVNFVDVANPGTEIPQQ